MRKSPVLLLSIGALALALGGCRTVGPAEPQVMVMPGKGKSFDAFQRDEARCQASAAQATGYRSPGQEANDSTVGGAVVGTAVGALAGAAIGAATGNAGAGAAIGAGSGLVGGTMVGGANGRANAGAVQARYDTVFAQCMSARGHRVDAGGPVYGYPPPPVYVETRPVYVGPGPYWGPGPYYRRGWW